MFALSTKEQLFLTHNAANKIVEMRALLTDALSDLKFNGVF